MGCKRCGGKKFFKTIKQDGGVCYGCDGTGDERLAKERRRILEEKANSKWVEELKEGIAYDYIMMNKPKLIGGDARREQIRKEAKVKFKTLKEKFGITLSLDEIETITEEL